MRASWSVLSAWLSIGEMLDPMHWTGLGYIWCLQACPETQGNSMVPAGKHVYLELSYGPTSMLEHQVQAAPSRWGPSQLAAAGSMSAAASQRASTPSKTPVQSYVLLRLC